MKVHLATSSIFATSFSSVTFFQYLTRIINEAFFTLTETFHQCLIKFIYWQLPLLPWTLHTIHDTLKQSLIIFFSEDVTSHYFTSVKCLVIYLVALTSSSLIEVINNCFNHFPGLLRIFLLKPFYLTRNLNLLISSNLYLVGFNPVEKLSENES